MFSQYLVFTDSAARLLSDDELLALSIRRSHSSQQKGLAGTLRIADSLVVYLMLVCVVVGMVIGGQAPLIGNLYRRGRGPADSTIYAARTVES